MLGYRDDSVLLRPITSILEASARKVCQERLRQLRADADTFDAEIILADGSVAPFNLIFIPQFRKSGKLTHYSVIIGPVGAGAGMAEPDMIGATPLKDMVRLRERALHASSNGIVITRCAGKNNPIEYVNPAFERITGYQAEEITGRDMRFMTAPGLDAAERALLRAAIIERREINVVFRNLRKNGEVFWNDLTVTPVLNERGKVTHFIGVINDVTASIRRTSHLEHELNHDVLTGLASRSLLWDRLDQALHVAQRNKTLVATVLVDLDNFKDVNDTFGHDGGDEVLRVVARRLEGAVRDSDTVARLGGDEFVLILNNQPSLRFTLRMIERLRQDMAKPVMVDNKEIDVRSSMGVSIFPHDASTPLEMIQVADVAMYHAKAAGRNDVHFFSAEMKAATEAKRKLETSMRSAVEKEEMFLVFQPRICLKTGKIIGAEALLRWRHPEQGVLLPASFILEAEESGLIIPLGEWVFSNICMNLQRLRSLGFHNLVMSMNVSFRELSQKNYVELIGKKLSELQLPPEALELEIKEAYLMRNPQMTKKIFSEISKLGLKLAIDEFGTGVSSLSDLHRLAVNHLKIPKSFIESINQQSADGVMAKTMIGIGHSMNLNVIAEGVETSLQMNFLKQNDCDEMQGNYFSEPICMQEFEQLLSKPNASQILLPTQ
jgi:diguanylate cyclase (GGDEF)-like protein/PAS domain S-box-containing protein